MSSLLVAAITIIPSESLKPDISVRSAFKVWSRSSFPVEEVFPPDLVLPMASISSIKITALPWDLAFLKRFLILLAPTPA